jgi:hypothetical protein
MSTTTPNSVAFGQNRFEEEYAQAEADHKKLSSEAKIRRFTAYFLKGLAIFGGIAVAAGLSGFWSHLVGIAIMAAVGIDSWLSNQKRLLLVTKAANAYKRLLKTTRHEYNQSLAPSLKLPETDPKRGEQIEAVIQEKTDKLFKEQQVIDAALEEEDLKLLNYLAMEERPRSPGTAGSPRGSGGSEGP